MIFSKTMVAWILSPPPRPLVPEDAVEMVCSRYPSDAWALSAYSNSVRLPDPLPHSFSFRMT